jgi:hypothetical protein
MVLDSRARSERQFWSQVP